MEAQENPTKPPLETFPFVGGNGIENYSDNFTNPEFPSVEVVQRKNEFVQSLRGVYEQEKAINPLVGNSNSEGGLTNLSNVEKMYFHTRVHAVTGLLEWGTSTTHSIPYWDIQALWQGLTHTVSQEEAEKAFLRNHIETIQALLTYVYCAGDTYNQSKEYLANMERFMSLGNVTRSNLSLEYRQSVAEWQGVNNRFESVLRAKHKHLLFITDQVHDNRLRTQLLKEISNVESYLGFTSESFSLDIGVDGGLTKDSYRPAYQIDRFTQLKHLQMREYSVSKEVCPVFTHTQLINSIGRPSNSASSLIDPTKDILLPWKF